MCKTCGCGGHGNGTQLNFFVKGYTPESAKQAEEKLLGLKGVLHVHIHAHDGETMLNYDPAKTPLSQIMGVFEEMGLQAVL